MGPALGLRGKSVLALLATCLLVLLLTAAAGWQAVASIRNHLGTAYARNLTLLNRERIVAPVSRELALSLRLAKSAALQQWLRDESDPARQALGFQEAESFRRDFTDHSYFIVSAQTNRYYFNDARSRFSEAPRYTLNASDAHDAWFFNTMKNGTPFNINVDPDVKLGLTKIWFNVLVTDGEHRLGLAGTGLDLSAFLQAFVGTAERGVTPMIVDANGAIQAHPDNSRIAFNSGTGAVSQDKSLFALLADEG
ncbi:histidine kinase, partial [Oxalobacteraceae bacterium OM1]